MEGNELSSNGSGLDAEQNKQRRRLYRRTLLRSTAAGTGLLGLSGISRSQEDSNFVDIIGSDPSSYPTIQLNVRVDSDAGRDGKLTKDDFTVFENGEERNLTGFEFSSTQLDIVFVFDDTGSMGDEIDGAKRQSKELTQQIADSGINARYGLISFKDDVEVDLSLTDDADSLVGAIDGLTAGGGGDGPEDNFDALERALEFDFRDSAQKVFVDITDQLSHYRDDGSGFSNYTLSEVKTDLMERGVTYVAVSPGFEDPLASKKNLAEEVGGLYVDINGGDFDQILRYITELIVKSYILQYETPLPAGTDASIGLTVTDPERGSGEATGTLQIPEDAGPNITLDDIISAKQDLTAEVDRLAATIDEQSRVTPTLDDLKNTVSNGDVTQKRAVEAVERMILVEDVAELSLAGLGSREATSGQEEVSLAGEPEDSIATDPSIDILGEVGVNAISGVMSMLSVSASVSRLVLKLGSTLPIADKLFKVGSKATSWIADLVDYLGPFGNKVRELGDQLWQGELKNNVLNSAYETGEQAYDAFSDAVDTVRGEISDHMMSGYESGDDREYPLDSTLERADSELGVEDSSLSFGGGSPFSGPDSSAKSVATGAREQITNEIENADQQMDASGWTAFIVSTLNAALAFAAATAGAGALAVAVVAGIGTLGSLIFTGIAIKRGLDCGTEVLNICDRAATEIVNGSKVS
ncbi:VWA domain-containing protein [Haloferax sp. YSSS75]|uniref:VWA domain-containing protein n=1 Tax=Haloferax sp. YSSS75 TaxID=3388564 RepID=UPI00398D35C5